MLILFRFICRGFDCFIVVTSGDSDDDSVVAFEEVGVTVEFLEGWSWITCTFVPKIKEKLEQID